MWPCVALDGSTWPYRLGSRPFREARRDPAWPCAAPDGTGTCPNLSNAGASAGAASLPATVRAAPRD